jgi:small subunit ribosomal protein S1
LGHKQIEESPWESFATVFTQGSYHQGLILRRDDKGAIVQLTYGLEAFAPIKQLKKEDGTTAEQGENLTFKIIEFNRDDKRVLVSHTRYIDDIRRENEAAEQKRKDAAESAVRNEEKAALKAAQDKVERSTLGELDALSQLKDKLN